MGASILAFPHRKPTASDWTNDELAELYRVVDILGRAGVDVEIETGLSDEGDPWLIICRVETGDVLAHFARIDGQFIAASTTLDATFRGANFRQIVEQLARSQPLMVPPPSQTGGTRLFMHPSVVLTAFVATALLHLQQSEADAGMAPAVAAQIDVPEAPEEAVTAKASLAQALQMMFRGAPSAQEDRSAAANAEKGAAQTVSLASVIAIAMSFVQHDQGAAVADETEVAEVPEPASGEDAAAAAASESAGDGPTVEVAAVPEDDHRRDQPLATDVPAGEARPAAGYAVAGGDQLKLEWAISPEFTSAGIRVTAGNESAGSANGVGPVVGDIDVGVILASLPGGAASDAAGEPRSAVGSKAAAAVTSGTSGGDAQTGSTATTKAPSSGSMAASADASDGAASGSATAAATVSQGELRTDLRLVSVEDVSTEAYNLLLSGARGTMSWWFAGGEGVARETGPSAGTVVAAPAAVAPIDLAPVEPTQVAADVPEDEGPQLFHTIAEFVFSERNLITTALQPSADLVEALDDYVAQNGNAPIRLVIFSSEDLGSEIFPFVPGVLFVERSHVGNKDLAQFADQPEMDSGIALVGVIDVDAGVTA